VRRLEVPHKVVAPVVDVTRACLDAPLDAALEGQTFLVGYALVTLELFPGGEGERADVALRGGATCVLADNVGPRTVGIRVSQMAKKK